MKKILCFFLLLCTILPLHGANLNLTDGVWYISIPENDGRLSPSQVAVRLLPGGNAELVLSEAACKKLADMQKKYRERTGEELPQPTFRWKWEDGVLELRSGLPLGKTKTERMSAYVSEGDPDVLMPRDKHDFTILARRGAKLSPERAKRFFRELTEANRDKFADGLKLPENTPLAEPEKELYNIHFFNRSHWRDAPAGSFQTFVVSAINRGPKLPDDAECHLPALGKLLATPEKKAVLLQYLACHSEWRLYRERDNKLHAVRYFRYPDGEIAPSLNQFYAHFLPTDPSGKKVGDPALEFQFRFDIGLDGRAWNASIMHPRNKTERWDGNTWDTRFRCGDALVDILDQSKFPGRQMTAAALELTEKEFAALDDAGGNWRKLLPKDSYRIGSPDLVLRNGMQGGIYEAAVWCNPGEKGTIYLKAFEITRGTPLSAKRLKDSSCCISGWSDDPREQFLSAMYFTIYEGDWGQFYGARFEIWFKPDAGGAERKLFEKNYKIQGWQR